LHFVAFSDRVDDGIEEEEEEEEKTDLSLSLLHFMITDTQSSLFFFTN
jgi:hypothetical protein